MKTFEVEVARACWYAKNKRDEIMFNSESKFGYGFHMYESIMVRRFTKDVKSYLEVKLHLLKRTIESVLGDGFQCDCNVYSDAKSDGYYWNIQVHQKKSLQDVCEPFRISI